MYWTYHYYVKMTLLYLDNDKSMLNVVRDVVECGTAESGLAVWRTIEQPARFDLVHFWILRAKDDVIHPKNCMMTSITIPRQEQVNTGTQVPERQFTIDGTSLH